MKVFITRIIPDAGMQLLYDAGIEVDIWREKRELTADELIEHCQHADALLSVGPNKIDKHFLQACSHLKVVALHSTGYNKVDVEAATALHIPIGNTPDVTSRAAADVAFLLLLSVARKAFHHHRKIINGEWGFFEPTAELGLEIDQCTLGILGMGKIGTELARRCVGAYGMNVLYCNRGTNSIAEKELGAVKVSFNELLAQSDIISVHTGLTASTTGIFNYAAFEKMKPNSIFINTARGAIHNEADLTRALANKLIWGAGLDVTDPEPMDKNNPLLYMPTVAVLPHIGSATTVARNAMSVSAAKNILAGLKGIKIPYCVNPEVYHAI